MSLITIDRSLFASNSDFSECNRGGEAFDNSSRSSQSEDFLMCKATAVGLNIRSKRRSSQIQPNDDIQDHLKKVLGLLRFGDYVQLVVRLQSEHPRPHHHRYCCVISTTGKLNTEESAILGIDITDSQATIGLVLPIWQDMSVKLYGDGGLELITKDTEKQFRPVSVQALWAAFQAINRACFVARTHDYYSRGLTHDWIGYYHSLTASTASQIQEWLKTDDIDSFNRYLDRNSASMGSNELDNERSQTEALIREKLQEIMYTVDLEEVTVLQLRQRLEEELQRSFRDYRHFIEEEVLVIYGRMDEASVIYDHLLLGTTFNASNRTELERRSVSHILNVTREVDNFFPGDKFEYKNIRVFDDETASLLPYFEETHRFINLAKSQGTSCLVHCKMGISRSATVVIAYVMKEQNCDLETALAFVKCRRPCIQPNQGFMRELCTYQGILEASSNRHKPIFRNESFATNLNASKRLSTITVTPPIDSAASISSKLQTVGRIAHSGSQPQGQPHICSDMENTVSSTNEIDLETELFAYKHDHMPLEEQLSSIPLLTTAVSLDADCHLTKPAVSETGPCPVWDLQGNDIPDVRSATIVARNSHLLRQWHPDLMEHVSPNDLTRRSLGIPSSNVSREECILAATPTFEQPEPIKPPKLVEPFTDIAALGSDCSTTLSHVHTCFDHKLAHCATATRTVPLCLDQMHSMFTNNVLHVDELSDGPSVSTSSADHSSANAPSACRRSLASNVGNNGSLHTIMPPPAVSTSQVSPPQAHLTDKVTPSAPNHSTGSKPQTLDTDHSTITVLHCTHDNPVSHSSAVVSRSITRAQSARTTPLQLGPSRLRPDDSWIICSNPSYETARRTRPVSELLSTVRARETTGTVGATVYPALQPHKNLNTTVSEPSQTVVPVTCLSQRFPSMEYLPPSLTGLSVSSQFAPDQSFTLFPNNETVQVSPMENPTQLNSEGANCPSYTVFRPLRHAVNRPPHSVHPVGADAR